VASGTGRLPLAQATLLAPIPRPARNLFCVGKNYRDHAREVQSSIVTADAVPELPIIFTKATTTVIGPGAPIPASLDPTASVDYEGELAVVIGRGGRGIARADAMRHVYGYTIVNDVTSRRLQKQHQQWFLGKSLDGFGPLGPAIVTADEVPDVGALRVRTTVNGELRQDGRVADLIFDIPALIETLARAMTLEPGDLIATGTPAGVGMGFTPPRFLKPGDVVAVTVEPIGTLENPVV
jgi:2-keto-4-pentenoate hydratase/2-oxohepta-3-ene-1,7-dioic acid hydratase in catechol pathway